MSFNPGNRKQVKTRRTELSGLGLIEKAWEIDMTVLKRKEFARQWHRV